MTVPSGGVDVAANPAYWGVGFFAGTAAKAAIYTSALSQTQVSNHYAAALVGPPPLILPPRLQAVRGGGMFLV
ncbi:MAG TPA: hypothetical protein VHV75_14965 [Solirubrobacteraceae bacterium]|jgi:hypothetical protein|nr:hypothetical protein [Solirubrobacteraceae bacterium]